MPWRGTSPGCGWWSWTELRYKTTTVASEGFTCTDDPTFRVPSQRWYCEETVNRQPRLGDR
jgi:hypothetical protein